MHLADGIRKFPKGKVQCLLQEVGKNVLFIFICQTFSEQQVYGQCGA